MCGIVSNLCLHYLPYCRSYHDPQPTDSAVQHSVNNFCMAVARSLKVGCIRANEFNVEFSLDVFRSLFNNKGTVTALDGSTRGKLYELSDFEDHFPKGWNTLYNKLGDGCTVDFPIVMLPSINYGPKRYYKKCNGSVIGITRFFSEIVSVSLYKRTC